jgi:NADH dehydrogenase FAD-containing subunit
LWLDLKFRKERKVIFSVSQHLIFVGGGHAHLTSLKNLSSFRKRGHRVTLISPSPYHYYSGMGPGLLSGIYHPWEVRFNIKKWVEDQDSAFIKGEVRKIDPGEHLLFLSSGEKVDYDVVSFNTGSEVPVEPLATMLQDNIVTVKPVVNLFRARHVILDAIKESKALTLVVVGGGPAGVEISGNLWRLLHENQGKGKITVIGGKKLMGDAPGQVRSLVLKSFMQRGIEVIEGSHAEAIQGGAVRLSDGRRVVFDILFLAIGIRPSTLFRESGLPTSSDGGLLVNSHLQSVAFPEIFGGGDCISLQGHSLARVGVYAVRENPILYHNLRAALEGGEMLTFEPQSHFLLIFNMGDGKGIFWKKNWVWESRLALLLKDYIDRKFMRKFQVSGELDERNERAE